MTVSSTTVRTQYTGDGATTSFATGFQFLENTDLIVIRTVIATEADTVLTLGSTGADGYSVTGAGQQSGGTVTVVTAPANATERLTIVRDVPATQLQNYTPNDPLPAETLEAALDKLTMIAQQTIAGIERAILLPDSSTGTPPTFPPSDPLKVIGWNSDGDLDNLVIGDPSDLVISAFMDSFLQESDAAGARSALGLGALATLATSGTFNTEGFLRGDGAVTNSLGAIDSTGGTVLMLLRATALNIGSGNSIAGLEAYNENAFSSVGLYVEKDGTTYIRSGASHPIGLRGNLAASDVVQITDEDAYIGDAANERRLGISRVLWETQNASYGFVLADYEGRKGFVKDDASTPTYTIPANASVAFPVGTVIPIANLGGSGNITVAITSDTLQLAGGTTTGSRTFAPGAFGGIVKVTATKWFAYGAGVT